MFSEVSSIFNQHILHQAQMCERMLRNKFYCSGTDFQIVPFDFLLQTSWKRYS